MSEATPRKAAGTGTGETAEQEPSVLCCGFSKAKQ